MPLLRRPRRAHRGGRAGGQGRRPGRHEAHGLPVVRRHVPPLVHALRPGGRRGRRGAGGALQRARELRQRRGGPALVRVRPRVRHLAAGGPAGPWARGVLRLPAARAGAADGRGVAVVPLGRRAHHRRRVRRLRRHGSARLAQAPPEPPGREDGRVLGTPRPPRPPSRSSLRQSIRPTPFSPPLVLARWRALTACGAARYCTGCPSRRWRRWARTRWSNSRTTTTTR